MKREEFVLRDLRETTDSSKKLLYFPAELIVSSCVAVQSFLKTLKNISANV